MKHWIAKAALSCILLTGMFSASPVANAARVSSYNLIWFDSAGNVIGQHAEFCNNYQLQGGAQTGAFALTIIGGCGEMIRDCEEVYGEDRSEIVCSGFTLNTALSASPSGNHGNLTAADLCGLTGACSGTEPILMHGYGFNIIQIYPVPKS